MKVLRWIWPRRTNSAFANPGSMRKTRCWSGHFIRDWKPTRLNWLFARFSCAELHDRPGAPAVGPAQADRLHRAVAERVDAAAGELLDRQAALEEQRASRSRGAAAPRPRAIAPVEGHVAVAVERRVEVVVAVALAVARRPEQLRDVERLAVDDGRDGVVEVEVRRCRGARASRSASAGEVSGPVATTTSPSRQVGRPPRAGARCRAWAASRSVMAAAKRSRSTARALPAGTACSRAAPMTSEPELFHLALEQARGVSRVVAAQRVRADQLGQAPVLCAPASPHRAHLVEHDRHAARARAGRRTRCPRARRRRRGPRSSPCPPAIRRAGRCRRSRAARGAGSRSLCASS